jgi:uncharacterized membrane protein YbhN (UPF0104 family)
MRPLRVGLGLLVSLALVWLLFRTTSLAGLARSIRDANYLTLAPAILVYFAGVWIRSARWGMLLRPVAVLAPERLFRATVIGFTVNDLMPVRLGEIARALLLVRWARVPAAATLGTIVVERLFDGLTLCAVLGLAWPWLPPGSWLRNAALLGGMLFAGGALGAAVAAFRPGLLLGLARFCTRILPERFRMRVLALCTSFLDGLAVLRQGRVLLITSALSTIAWLTEATMYYLIMRGFGFDSGPLSALLGMAAANLGTMIPSLPGFIGTFDVPLKAVLTDLFGVDGNLATSYTLVVHAALFVPVVLVGLAFLWRERLSIGEVSRRATSGRPTLGRSTDPVTRAL